MTAPVFGPPLIGQTEKALNAILEQQLAGTEITEPQWVALTLTAVSGGTLQHDQLIGRINATTQFGVAAATERIAELTAAGLVRTNEDGTVSTTEAGQAQWTSVRTNIGAITGGLWGDLPADDLATAARVLATVLQRASAVLA